MGDFGGAGSRFVARYFLGIVFPESGLIWGCYGVVLGKQSQTIERWEEQKALHTIPKKTGSSGHKAAKERVQVTQGGFFNPKVGL